MTDPAPPPVRARRVTRRALLERWWLLPVAGTLGTFGYMGWYASRVTLGKRAPGTPAFQDAPAQRVAALEDLQATWAEVTFTYAGRPCTLLRLPSPTPGSLGAEGGYLAGFSRVCTHLGCSVNLVRDAEVLAFAFNYRAPGGQDHPQLGCRCHYSVFDPLRAGEAVFGKALAPLPRVRLEVRGPEVWATGIEPAPTPSG
ncbi:Rieske 2Fe-2S domain-containing protein [Deinococcus radiotolerans]|uniref:Cytochrome Complex iron-sulfur subunit n=1 Tax=Deinococcus radiotolerans TaxID=1309407 RepID=A0ABQ2FGQ9_9DEIO|nr:Rieske 2Fe-2S domain-containing protein [Deinococcus radiotolerans]GGK93392.1 cytochrome Complex iron-sulfur subunit [Deinococcus radiotolerans]